MKSVIAYKGNPSAFASSSNISTACSLLFAWTTEKSPFSQRQRYKAISIPPRKECNRLKTTKQRYHRLLLNRSMGNRLRYRKRRNMGSHQQRTRISPGENWHLRALLGSSQATGSLQATRPAEG